MNLAEETVKLLIKKGRTLATAESCTGGKLAASVVDVSGASACFYGGYVTYANEAKEQMIHVSGDTLKAYGAVSEQTAREMAAGTLKTTGADYALSTTGIAGPGGGTEKKPVGLVYIACGGKEGIRVTENHFSGSREEIRNAAVKKALELLTEALKS